MSLRRDGCHAAPLHESLPVAWRWLLGKLRAASDRRPGARAADAVPEGPATPLAGRGAVPAAVPRSGRAVPPIDTALLTYPLGEHPYPPADIEEMPRIPVFDNSAEAARKLLAALEHLDDGTEAAS